MAELYASGYSLEQIAKKLNKAKSTVKGTLRNLGIVFRPASGSPEFKKLDKNSRRSAHPPFGFVVVRNKFVAQPKEMEVLLELKKLWKSGRGPRQIADRLNVLGLDTRSKKPWAHSVVTGILNRFKKNQHPYNEVKS
jgi:DNA-binding CsgD family transcriptional regulator